MIENERGLELLKSGLLEMMDEDLEKDNLSATEYAGVQERLDACSSAFDVIDLVMEYADFSYEDMVQWVYGTLVAPLAERD